MANAPESQNPKDSLKRKRLERSFEHAQKMMGTEEYNHEYAHQLLAQCVAGDPGNDAYMQSFLENLHKKYGNNGKGDPFAMLRRLPLLNSMKKAMSKADWPTAMKQGLELLKLNPWDTWTLSQLATVNDHLGNQQCHLLWLRQALRSNPNDPDVNRQSAIALTRLREYDQAIACWHRVEKARPDDEEALREISNLALRKAREQGKLDESLGMEKPHAAARELARAEEEMSPENRLLRAIAATPTVVKHYYDLMQIYFDQERYKEAEDLAARALKILPDDIQCREHWEDAHLRHWRYQVAQAEKKAKESGAEAAVQEYKQIRRQRDLAEVEVYKARCERYPGDLKWKYELGYRFKQVGDYNEAIRQLQTARVDPRYKGRCLFALAQCFQAIKQWPLAMDHYRQAIDEIPDRLMSEKKQALYLAGKLAMGLGDIKQSQQYLTRLAEIDFAYRDVAALLNKLQQKREEEGGTKGEAKSAE